MTKFKKTLLNKLDNMENRITSVEKKLEQLEELPNMQNNMENMQEQLNQLPEMQKTLLLIEDKVTTNFPALFEIYSLNYELQKEDKKKIEFLKNLTDDNSNRISVLEDISENHSKKLSKLIS